MKITNIRLGFATNSSSSHSVLVMENHHQHDSLHRTGWGYGWETFTLASEELKKHYLAAQLAPALGYNWYPQNDKERRENVKVTQLLNSILGSHVVREIEDDEDLHVDHQSAWSWPKKWDGTGVDMEFVKSLVEFVSRQDVLILGGNDNGGTHPLVIEYDEYGYDRKKAPEGTRFVDLDHSYEGDLVARQDGEGWTLFNRKNGTKVRLWFGEGNEPAFASRPELVDIKITDFCPFGCVFCYQDSTKEGEHAPLENLKQVASQLGEAKVFEVAIGGGEPTLHPNFIEILALFKEQGIIPNFTTRNLTWLKDKNKAQEIKKYGGTFAYSVQTVDELKKFADLVDKNWKGKDYWERRPNVHIVMGTVPREIFREMMSVCKELYVRPTLLGYKRVGRADAPKYPYQDWVLEEMKEGPYTLGIDTALAAEIEDQLEAAGINSRTYHTEDGLFSAYIDAVKMTMAPSSWEPERPTWSFEPETWANAWQYSQHI